MAPGSMEERQQANENLRSVIQANALLLVALVVLAVVYGNPGSVAARVGGFIIVWICFLPAMSWFVLRRRAKKARKSRNSRVQP
jgi:F0F1-type ATP synthase assembly protein I